MSYHVIQMEMDPVYQEVWIRGWYTANGCNFFLATYTACIAHCVEGRGMAIRCEGEGGHAYKL